MLFRPHNPVRRPHSFQQQLNQLRNPVALVEESEKVNKNYQLTVTILQLLIEKSPQLTQQLLILKQSISKWYQHVKQQKISRTRQIFDLREKTIVRIKKEVGIVLEEISYYLRSIMEEYNDKNLQRFYVLYLMALKKLEWGTSFDQKTRVNQQVQTIIEEGHLSNGIEEKKYEKTSLETIQSPRKKFKEVDMHKYLETRQENIDLQKECNALNRQIADLQFKMQRLQQQLSRYILQNDSLKQNEKVYLEEVEKLSKILEQMKQAEEMKKEKERQAEITLMQTKQKYQQFNHFKDKIYRNLDQAEQQIKTKQKQENERNAEEFFNRNYLAIHDGFSDSEPSSQIYLKNHEKQEQNNSQYRMLLVQAFSLEQFLEHNVVDLQLSENGSQ